MEYKGIKLTLDMETKEFDSAINRVKNSTNSLNNDINNLKKALKLDPNNLEVYTAYQNKLKAKIEETKNAANFLKDALKTGLDSGEIEKYGTKWEHLTTRIIELNSQIDRTQKELDNLSLGNIGKTFESAIDKADVFFANLKANLASKAIEIGFNALKNAISTIWNGIKQIGVGFYNLMKSGVEYNAEMQGYTTTINEILGGDVEQTNKLVNSTKQLAIQYGFSAASLLDMSQKLLVYDKNTERLTATIKGVVSALSLFGKGNAELTRVSTNLLQIQQNGSATARDLREFSNAGIAIYDMLANYSDRFKGDFEATSVSYEDLVGAIIKSTTELDSIYAKSGEIRQRTFQGQLDILQAEWQMFWGAMAEDTTSTLTNEVLPSVNEFMGKLLTAFYGEDGEGGFNAMITAFEDNIGQLINDLSNSGLIEQIIAAATALIDAIILAFDPDSETGAKNLKALEDLLDKICTKLSEFLTSPTMKTFYGEVGLAIGGAIASGIGQAISAYLEQLKVKYGGIANEYYEQMEAQNSINSSRSGGYGFRSGGYGNTITLNASFVSNGALDEKQAMRFADIITERVNQNLYDNVR